MPTPIRPRPKAKPKDRNGYGLYELGYPAAFNDRHNGATTPLGPLSCSCPSPIPWLDEETDETRCWKCGKQTTNPTRRRRP